MAKNFVTGADIGTSSIKVAVAENRGGRPALKAVFKEVSSGIRKGAIVDLAEASQAVIRAVSRVKKISKAAAKNIYVSIGTHQARSQMSEGMVTVSRADTEIYQDDINRVLKSSQAINLSHNRTIIHNIAKEFIVDGVSDITDPLGLSGNRLEVKTIVIDAFSPHIKSLVRSVELAGGEVSGLVFTPLVSSRSALSKGQKDLGTVLIDIGAGTTGIGVYEENKLAAMTKFPVGAGNISNDLAIGLKIPVSVAEAIKLNFGYALAKEVGQKEIVELNKFIPESRGTVSRRFVAEIIESRLEEIFEFVNNELKAIGKNRKLPGGVVLVGGGAKIPGLTDLARQELMLASQIGSTLADEWSGMSEEFTEFLEDPEYVNAFGLVLWGVDDAERWQKNPLRALDIKNWFKYFVP